MMRIRSEVILAVLLVLSLTACGSGGQQPQSQATPTDPAGGGDNTSGGTENSGSDNSGSTTDPGEGTTDNTNPTTPTTNPLDPGHIPIHRLNRAEYNATVNALLGNDKQPANQFPPDDISDGFDNIAETLSSPPSLVDMYFKTAQALVEDALRSDVVIAQQFEAETYTGTPNETKATGRSNVTNWKQHSNGYIEVKVQITTAGSYTIAVRAWADLAGADQPQMQVLVDGTPIKTFAVNNVANSPKTYQVTTDITATGQKSVRVAFLNDYNKPATSTTAQEDRNLYFDWVRVDGPQGASSTNEVRSTIVTCDGADNQWDTCAQKILADFGKRAWRRPLTSTELNRLLTQTHIAKAENDTFETGIKLALTSILTSPNFVYRIEIDPNPTSAEPRTLNNYELASRLAYFLWSGPPDKTLLDLAQKQQLSSPTILRQQFDRMYADPKAKALVDNFAEQWLTLRALDQHDVDPAIVPDFNKSELAIAMRKETRTFLARFISGEISANRLLTAESTYSHPALESLYGSGVRRQGLLTQASLLTLTADPKRTSLVRRGNWVLTNLLCTPPPPPPPGVVDSISEGPVETGTLRQKVEQHRANPVCASCHVVMDNIGFGLENYDNIGRYRTTELDGSLIDTRGTLPGNITFNDASGLSLALSNDERFPACVSKKLFTYALGRAPTDNDTEFLSSLTQAWKNTGMHFPDLAWLIINSDRFLTRRGDIPPPDTSQPKDPDIAIGAAIYNDMCVSCHSNVIGPLLPGSELAKNPTLPTLSKLINDRMPLNNPKACQGSCAETVAKYVLDAFVTNKKLALSAPAN